MTVRNPNTTTVNRTITTGNSASSLASTETLSTVGMINDNVQIIKIKLPPPPLGSTLAKVVVGNVGSSTEESQQEVYFEYLDACTTPAQPATEPVPRVSEEQLENAYDECIDLVAALYCSPVTSSLEIPEEETPDPIVKNYKAEHGELYPGDETILSFVLEGIGFFQIFQTAEGQNIKLAEESFNIPEEEVIKINISIPSEVPRNIQSIQYILVVKNKDNENISPQPPMQTIIIKREIVPPPVIPKNEIKPDNDFGDAKKEIYYMRDFVAGVITENEKFIIDKNISYYENFDYANSYNPLVAPKDLFRDNNGSFYMMNEQEADLISARNRAKYPSIVIIPNSAISTSRIKPLETRDREGFGYIQDNFSYSRLIKPQGFREGLAWETYRNYFFPKDKDNSVIDFSYSYLKPYTEKELGLIGEKALNSAVIEQRSEYNFYNKKYEEIHYDISEALLPNMYFLALNREGVDAQKTTKTEDDIIIDPDIRAAITLDENLLSDNAPIDIKTYYDFYIKQNKTKKITNLELLNRIKNIYVTYEFLDKFEQYNSTSEMHPMKIELSFTKPRYSFVSKILKDSKISDRTMFYWLSKFQNNETENFDSIKQEFGTTQKGLFVSNNRYIDITDKTQFDGSERFGGQSSSFYRTKKILDNFVFLGNYNSVNEILTSVDSTSRKNVRKRIANLLSLKARTYFEILENKKCYRETLYYRIAKFDGDPKTSEPIQNIYLPNDPDKNSLRYIDTQVKYDKRYTYVIYTYDVVFGNEYYSNGHEIVDQISRQQIKNYPKLFLVENIFDQIEAKVKDKPPIYPSVDIHSYKGVDNQILFLLNKSSGTIKTKEITIKQGDSEIFEEIRRSQNLSNDDLIEFSGDDIIKKYEVFRLESPPRTYQDFDKGKMITIDTLLDPAEPNKRANAVSLKDTILPNKKYYYTFRCTDIHDQISNPSEVYEIKMINESETIFLLWDIYKFEQQNDKQASKAMKRFLMVKPDFLQESFEIDPGNSKNKDDLRQKITKDIYSSQNKSIWDKKYKLRLVSKNTNKVYDINFKFGVETKIIE